MNAKIFFFILIIQFALAHPIYDSFISLFKEIEESFSFNDHLNRFLLPYYKEDPNPKQIKSVFQDNSLLSSQKNFQNIKNARILDEKKPCNSGEIFNVTRINYYCNDTLVSRFEYNGNFFFS